MDAYRHLAAGFRHSPAPPRVNNVHILGEPGGNLHLPTAQNLSLYQKMRGRSVVSPVHAVSAGMGQLTFPEILFHDTLARQDPDPRTKPERTRRRGGWRLCRKCG